MSDTHFGKTEDEVIVSLIEACVQCKPDLVVISGDVTQLARVKEFESARKFLESLRAKLLPMLIIPGNHDIRPLLSPIKRTLDPYDRYNNFIVPFSVPSFVDEEIAVHSINTVRASRFKNGYVSKASMVKAQTWFDALPTNLIRIVVSHHPLDLPEEHPKRKLASHAEWGIYELAKSHIDIYLSGHYHRSGVVHTTQRYRKDHYAAVAIQAGTISNRMRGELYSFNLLKIKRTTINITPYVWDVTHKDFVATTSFDFVSRDNQWIPSQ